MTVASPGPRAVTMASARVEGEERLERVDAPHEEIARQAAEVARGQADRGSGERADRHDGGAHREGHPRAPHDAAQDVPAEAVGPQRMLDGRNLQSDG